MIPYLVVATTAPMPREETFALFTAGLNAWWPVEYSWSGESLTHRVGMETAQDGSLYEIGPSGLRWDWGQVLAWEPSDRVAFSWQIGPDRSPVPAPEGATEVDVTFETATATSTTVTVTQGHWERHGDAGRAYRDNLEHAWTYALERLVRVAATPTPGA